MVGVIESECHDYRISGYLSLWFGVRGHGVSGVANGLDQVVIGDNGCLRCGWIRTEAVINRRK